MHILKKRNGIDIKAKNTGLHGSVTIQFGDPITGKIVDEVKHDNFFTDALDSILNGCPWGLNNFSMMGVNVNADANTDTRIGQIFDTLLGGVALFPQSLGDSLDSIYAPFTNLPTAYASKASYTASNPKQGVFNGVESGPLQNPNGYQYVYDWNTSQGTGTIASVALMHKNAYEYFGNGIKMMFPQFSNNNSDNPRGYYGYIAAGIWNGCIAADDSGVLLASNDDNLKHVRFFKIRPFDLQMLSKTNGSVMPTDTPDWELTVTGDGVPSWEFYDGYLYCILKNTNNTADTTIIKINKATGSIIETITRRWDINLTTSRCHFALKNGYLYGGATVAGKICKCSLSSNSDCDYIECDAVANESLCTHQNTDFIYGCNIIVNNDIVQPLSPAMANINVTGTAGANRIVYQNGVWIVTASRPYNINLSAQICTPYLATKNNLAEAKNKTANKTMKVIYTVTQQ